MNDRIDIFHNKRRKKKHTHTHTKSHHPHRNQISKDHTNELTQLRRARATADNKIMSMNMGIPTKDPIKEPEMRSQNELNCWQMANQFAWLFPLCAKYTIAADAEAPAVRRPSIAYIKL